MKSKIGLGILLFGMTILFFNSQASRGESREANRQGGIVALIVMAVGAIVMAMGG